MKSFQTSLTSLLMVCFLALLQQGCNVTWQVVNDPYANYHRIEQRVQFQVSQIDSSVQNGSLDAPTAQVLAENDDMVRQLAWRYQSSQSADLTFQQANFLDSVLNDNGAAINDAMTRRAQWASAFQDGWDFSYDSIQDRSMYIAWLHYQSSRQQAAIDDAYQNGQLTSSQAQALRARVQTARNAEINCYLQNGRLDLNRDQIEQLSVMTGDNGRYIRFRTHHRHGSWNGDRYGSWSRQRQQYADHPWGGNRQDGNSANPAPSNGAHYWDGRATQVQAPIPTATPTTVYRLAAAAWAPTSTPRPAQVVSAPPTAAPMPSQSNNGNQSMHPQHPDHPSTGPNSQSSPSNTQNSAPSLPAPTAAPSAPSQGLGTHAANPAPVAKFLPPDSLNARFKQQGQRLQKLRQSNHFPPTAFSPINQRQNTYQRVLNNDLKQNQQKGLTQDQMNQLSKMLDDIDKGIGFWESKAAHSGN